MLEAALTLGKNKSIITLLQMSTSAAAILPFSGCAIFMGGLSQNLIQRAQTDNANCSAT